MTDDEGNRQKCDERRKEKNESAKKNYVFSFVFCPNITITVTPRSIVLEALTQGCLIKPNILAIIAVFLNPF